MSGDWFVIITLALYTFFLGLYLVKILKEDKRDEVEQKRFEQKDDIVV